MSDAFVCSTCCERDRGMLGRAPAAAPPKEKVRLWDVLRVAWGVCTVLPSPLMRSKSSADGGTEFEGGAVTVVEEEPNKSVTVGADVETGGVEKALQSSNSPFPVEEAAAKENTFMS